VKVDRKPYTTFFPVPPVLVSCSHEDKDNLITIAWAGIVNTEPPMVSISVRPERFSYNLIKESGEFVINLAKVSQAREVDYCGVTSGREIDKFQATHFTKGASKKVKTPIVNECPVNLECQVKQIIPLGTHHMFIGEIVNIQANEEVIGQHNLIDIDLMSPLAYATPNYWSLGKKLGLYGFSRKS
jgi:flavin reductase (DIM6/NTAB) family NADH-FMN oxidoreductase RutF